MKKPLEITLTTVHVGAERRVVALQIGDRDLVTPFLQTLERQNKKAFGQLRTAMRLSCEHKNTQNRDQFKNLGGGLYEFKTRLGVRVYAFVDEHDETCEQLVIAALGAGKSKQQNSDILKARQLHKKYLELRYDQGVKPTLLLLPHEQS